MKYVKYFMVFFISLLLVNLNVYAASSKFEPVIDVETEIIEDKVFLIVGYEGEKLLALTQEIAFENRYLELDSISPLGDFEITKGDEHDTGTYSTVKMLADSNKAYEEVKYAILAFKVKDAFKVGKSTTVFLYNYDAVGPNKDKYRHKGFEIEIKRDSFNEAMFLKNPIDDSTKTKMWWKEHLILFIIGFIVIICVIIFIFLMPSKRKTEDRSKDLKKKIANAPSDSKAKISPIKLDQDFISSLGEEKKEVDMSEAIEVSDLKPFGDAAGKFDTLTQKDQESQIVDADVFAMEASGIKDLEDDDEDETIEILDSNDNDDKIDTLSLFILILITSTLFIGSVRAIEYNIPKLKENIVNDLKYDKEIDYNNDKKIDLLDLLETKDLSKVETDEKEYDVPNYEPIDKKD